MISLGIAYQILMLQMCLKLANATLVSQIRLTKASLRMNEMSAKHAMVHFMGSCVSTSAQINVRKRQKVLVDEAASATNVKRGTMGRLVQKSVHQVARHASW